MDFVTRGARKEGPTQAGPREESLEGPQVFGALSRAWELAGQTSNALTGAPGEHPGPSGHHRQDQLARVMCVVENIAGLKLGVGRACATPRLEKVRP